MKETLRLLVEGATATTLWINVAYLLSQASPVAVPATAVASLYTYITILELFEE